MTAPVLFDTVQELVDAMPRGKRLLGLDIGDKTVGVAISDPMFMVASPVRTVERGRKLGPTVDELQKIVTSEEVGGLLAGLPISMDGTEGPRSQKTRDLTREFASRLGLPAAFWDERLSTAAVERVLIGEADMSRKKRGQVVDQMAAAYILQGALDALAHRQ